MIEYIVFIALGTYYLTTIITDYDGMFGIFYKMRQLVDMLSCFGCTSLYVSALLSVIVIDGLQEIILATLAACGIAMLVKKIDDKLIS